MSSEVFDRLSERYDAWFDSPQGTRVFAAEVECLERLLPPDRAGWVEVGVGTGRFASALKIAEGVDPSRSMIRKAAGLGISTREARAENLPYAKHSLDGILLVVTLCFLDEPEKALQECARALKVGGHLLVGLVPAESAWGRFYRTQGRQGHPFYSAARFYTCEATKRLAAAAGFEYVGGAGTLPMGPGEDMSDIPVMDGVDDRYGFAAMLFRVPPGKENGG